MEQQPDSPLPHQAVDDFYFSALLDDDDDQNDVVQNVFVQNDAVPISDDKYAQKLQFQETLMASLITSQQITTKTLSSTAPSSSNPLQLTLSPNTQQIQIATKETDESSSSSSFSLLIICEICAEAKETDQMFKNERCNHSFCSDCVTKQVATKIQESITVVSCPGLNCKGVLDLDACRPMLPKDLLDRWNDALCEAHFLTVPKFYCPFRDCSAMLLVEEEEEEIRESECPLCHRLFCARCCVPWHPGVQCEEFQTLNEDERGREDLLVRELVNQKKWSRCPQCKFYVEKTEGCVHITCRCKFQFCYACGEQWTSTHGGCQTN